MWYQADAPLKIQSHASLGDPLFVLETDPVAAPDFPRPAPAVPARDLLDIHLAALQLELLALQRRVKIAEDRIAELTTQTPAAYWARFVGWLRSLWPWH